MGSLGLFHVVLGGAWSPSGGHVGALGGHLDGTWEPLQGPLGALWAQFGVDFEQICAESCVKSCAVTTKTDFCESAESYPPVDRNQGFLLQSSAKNIEKSDLF